MKKMHLWAGLLGVALACAIAVAQDANKQDSTDHPDKPVARAGGRGKLTAPWNRLSSLSDEVKEQIIAIHIKANEEIRAIKDKEEADIMALLNDDQKAELKAMEEKARAEAKLRRAEKKAAGAGDDKTDDGSDDRKDK